MIVKFSFSNYKSVYKTIDLSFVAESLKQLEGNTIQTSYPKLYLLKSIGLFGRNGTGKSNIVKALMLMKDFVLESGVDSIRHNLKIDNYKLAKGAADHPTIFKIQFIINGTMFHYGFELNRGKVRREYLDLVMKTTSKNYFNRIDQDIEVANSFHEGHGKSEFVKDDSLFLSTVAQLRGNVSNSILEWFNKLTVITDTNYLSFTGKSAKIIRENRYQGYLETLLKAVNIDFHNVEINPVNINENLSQLISEDLKILVKKYGSEQYKILTKHRVAEEHGDMESVVDFDLNEESAGTQKFFAIAGVLLESLYEGTPLIIDELDSKLHIDIIRFIIGVFNNTSINRHGSQLLFSTHVQEVIDDRLFRRDQIVNVFKINNQTKISTMFKDGARHDVALKSEFQKRSDVNSTPVNQLDLFNWGE